MAAEIYLVRHGETEWNAAGRVQGAFDSPLTARGRAQAMALGGLLARRFAGAEPPPLQASPLGRALDTAAVIAGCLPGRALTTEPRLREIAFGSWDGLTRAEVVARWPDRFAAHEPTGWLFGSPDGEGFDAAAARVADWLAEQSGPVIAVSHAMTGRLIRGLYLGLGQAEMIGLATPQDCVWRLADGTVEALR